MWASIFEVIPPLPSIDGKTIEESSPTCALERGLAAPFGGVRRIPGRAVADAIGMSDLRRTNRAAGPVITRVIGVVVVSAAVPLRSGKNLMLNRRRIANAVNELPMLVACGLLEQIAAALRLNQSIAVKLAQIRGDNGVLRRAQLRERPVEPRSGANTITRVDRGLSGASLGAEIGVPGVSARTDSRRQRLAVRVGSRKSAKISAFPDAHTGDEEGHSRRSRTATWGWRDALSIELSRRLVLLRQEQARRDDEDGFFRHPS